MTRGDLIRFIESGTPHEVGPMKSTVRILRSSQGDENKVSLTVQDEMTAKLAEDLDATIE